MEFKDVNFFDNPEDAVEQPFTDAIDAMAAEGTLADGLQNLVDMDSWYRDSPDNDSDEHMKIKEKISLLINFMEENGMADEAEKVLRSSDHANESPESNETQDEIRHKAEQLWESGDRVGALEAVLGRYVNASELQENPIFRGLILARSADEAYGAALMIKTIEDNSSIRSQPMN